MLPGLPGHGADAAAGESDDAAGIDQPHRLKAVAAARATAVAPSGLETPANWEGGPPATRWASSEKLERGIEFLLGTTLGTTQERGLSLERVVFFEVETLKGKIFPSKAPSANIKLARYNALKTQYGQRAGKQLTRSMRSRRFQTTAEPARLAQLVVRAALMTFLSSKTAGHRKVGGSSPPSGSSFFAFF